LRPLNYTLRPNVIVIRLLDNTVGGVVQCGCAKWRARVITNWLLILISRIA